MQPSDITHDRVRRLSWGILVSAAILYAVGLAWFAERMAPVHRGTAEAFWMAACGVALTPELERDWWLGDARFVDGRYATYELSHLHGSDIYYVPIDEVLARFDDALAALDARLASGDDDWILEAYQEWRASAGGANAQSLVEEIAQARRRRLTSKDPSFVEYFIEQSQQFYSRWRHAERYWLNIVFEWLFLTGITLFALWPGLRRQSIRRWAIHAACLPMLFLLPAFLGYSTYSFTSISSPGGVLYHEALRLIGTRIEVPGTPNAIDSIDDWIVEILPQFLQPLSTPAWPIQWEFVNPPGPIDALIAGLALGGAILSLPYVIRWIGTSATAADPAP